MLYLDNIRKVSCMVCLTNVFYSLVFYLFILQDILDMFEIVKCTPEMCFLSKLMIVELNMFYSLVCVVPNDHIYRMVKERYSNI